MGSVLSAVSSILVGTILAVAPWTGLWESNYLLQPHPALRAFLLNSFTRGGITGLGLVNILLALQEARQHFSPRSQGDGLVHPPPLGLHPRRRGPRGAEAEDADEGGRRA